jgi:hypothetical protein
MFQPVHVFDRSQHVVMRDWVAVLTRADHRFRADLLRDAESVNVDDRSRAPESGGELA